ncbi:MAG TPA: alpha-L-fucosidase [Candidatus Hydrogenedentes bacterium]|nr:alpha-L-fucosidase [Candidatus Hydrogenedentota bacterium]
MFSMGASLMFSLSLAGFGAVEGAPWPVPPLPTPQQIAWQAMETNLFIHFTVNAFTDKEWGEGTENPKIFNPTKLDAGQWARAAKAGGFKTMILTAKHHDGFCLWPSKYTEHSVKNSPWRDGKGDLVREFVEACRAEGLNVGFYLSPWDRHEPSYGDSPKYNDHYCNQLTELMTQYGPVVEVWFDGACGEGPNGKKQEYDWARYIALIRRYQPQAVIFSDAGPDVRWIGNESGSAGETCWSTMDPFAITAAGKTTDATIKLLGTGVRGGAVWRPGETDVSIRPGWFWHAKEDAKVRSVDNLIDLYFQSVGRNSLLLLNVPPNSDGLFSDTDVQRLAEFRQRLDAMFQNDFALGKAASAISTRGKSAAFAPANVLDGNPGTYWAMDDGQVDGWVEIDLGAPATFSISCLQEPIALGQRVASYRLEWLDDNIWKLIVRGTTIGYKKLDRFKPVTARKIRLVIEDARACPLISAVSLYDGK